MCLLITHKNYIQKLHVKIGKPVMKSVEDNGIHRLGQVSFTFVDLFAGIEGDSYLIRGCRW